MTGWHLKGTPFKVQQMALEMSEGLNDFAYFLDPGLGKTSTTYADFKRRLIAGDVDVMVVICPSTLREVWKTQAEEWELGLPVYVWDVDIKPAKYHKFDAKPPYVVAVNFEAVGVGKGQDFIEMLCARHKVYCAIDESIGLKDSGSSRTKSVLQLRTVTKIRRVLSGEPVVQGPHDLWGQLRFINAHNMKPMQFKYTFCRMGGWQGRKVVGSQNEHILQDIMKGCTFRAKKGEWTDIPPKMQLPPRQVPLTKRQSELYLELHHDLYAYIAEADAEVSAEMVLAKMEKLSQILSGFVKADDGRIIELEGGTGRTKECLDLIEQTGKVIVFCRHVYAYEMLLREFAHLNPAKLVGGMLQDEITENKNRFNNDPTCKVIVCQQTAGKYGHTLIGSEEGGWCYNTVYYENTFSLDDRIQSEDRTNRFGQPHPTNYHDFVSAPLDKQIIKALQTKQDIANAIIQAVRNPDRIDPQ